MKNKTKEKTRGNTKPTRLDFAVSVARRVKKGAGKALKSTFSKYSDMLCEELENESASAKERVKVFFASIGLALLSVFLSRCEMGDECFPLSIAILSATGIKRKGNAPFTPRLIMALSLGTVMISCLFMGHAGVLYFATLTTLFILRSVMTRGEFDESNLSRTLISFFTAFLLGFMGAIVSDFALLSLVAWVTLITVSPIFTYLFSFLFDMLGKNRTTDSKERESEHAAFFSLAFCVVFSLSEMKFLGLGVAPLLAFCATMCVSKKYGAMKGALTGFVLGAACSSAVFSASFGLTGLFAGLFFFSDIMALLVSVLISTVVSVYLGGSTGFLSVVPETMAGFLILWPLLLKIEHKKGGIVKLKSPLVSSSCFRASDKLEKMSGIFSSLSEVFFAVSDTARVPDTEGVRTIVENSCNKVCAACSLSSKCWGKEWRDTNGTLDALSEVVIKKGKLEKSDFPEYFSLRCPKCEEICENVNSHSRLALFKRGDLDAVNLIAGEYRTVSKLLKSTAEVFSKFPDEDKSLSKKAESALAALSIEYGFVESWGGRNSVVDVVGVHPDKISASTLDVLSTFESECGIRFEEPEFINGEKNTVMRLKRRRSLHLECAKNTCAKKGESVNGDSVSFFESDEGHFYALIADGMGSGHDAALTSRLATVFLEKLLTCTHDKSVTLEMLNSMLVSNNTETFTTLDLAEIDLYEKRAVFIKAGAPSSYIVRGERVYKVESETPPAGIIDEIRAEETRTSLHAGDIVVLLSDGVSGDEESFALSEFLLEKKKLSASELSRAILSSSLSRFQARDDMSVAVIKVYED